MQQMAAAYGPYGPYGPYGMGMMPPPMPFPPRSQIPDDQQSIQSFHFDTDARSDRHVKRIELFLLTRIIIIKFDYLYLNFIKINKEIFIIFLKNYSIESYFQVIKHF